MRRMHRRGLVMTVPFVSSPGGGEPETAVRRPSLLAREDVPPSATPATRGRGPPWPQHYGGRHGTAMPFPPGEVRLVGRVSAAPSRVVAPVLCPDGALRRRPGRVRRGHR